MPLLTLLPRLTRIIQRFRRTITSYPELTPLSGRDRVIAYVLWHISRPDPGLRPLKPLKDSNGLRRPRS